MQPMNCAVSRDAEKAVFKSGKGYFVAFHKRYYGHYSDRQKAVKAAEAYIRERCTQVKRIYMYY